MSLPILSRQTVFPAAVRFDFTGWRAYDGTFLGPAPTITPDEITEDMLSSYQCIYIEGYLLVNEELVRTTMQKAKKLGLKVALDLSNFNIVNAFRGLLDDIIPQYVDILFSNESEAEAFTGLKAHEAVKLFRSRWRFLWFTLGKEGALVGSKGQVVAVPAEGGKPSTRRGLAITLLPDSFTGSRSVQHWSSRPVSARFWPVTSLM